jgi:hypothetical protein
MCPDSLSLSFLRLHRSLEPSLVPGPPLRSRDRVNVRGAAVIFNLQSPVFGASCRRCASPRVLLILCRRVRRQHEDPATRSSFFPIELSCALFFRWDSAAATSISLNAAPLSTPLAPRLRSKVRTPLPPLLSCAPSCSTGARTPARYAPPPSGVGCQGRRSRHPFGLDRSKPHSKPCTGARDRTTPASLRQAAAARRPLPRRPRPGATRAVRLARTVQIKSGAYPLDRSTVDRVHKRRSTSLRQHRVSSSQSQLATWHSLSLSAGCLGNFAKRTPSSQNSQIYPSTYIKAFQAGPCFHV